MVPFKISPSSKNRTLKSSVICLAFTSLRDSGVLKLQISELLIRPEGEPEFRDADFTYIPYNVDRSFYVELDPLESRDYSVALNEPIICSYDFRITVIDKLVGPSQCFHLEGRREGVPLARTRQPNEADLTRPTLGMVVRLKPDEYQHSLASFIVCPEDGTKNEFGIFNSHDINPVATYTDLGRDGYATLTGQHFAELEWDRDTVASPPEDRWAVHVRSVDRPSEHGWYFRAQLLAVNPTSG